MKFASAFAAVAVCTLFDHAAAQTLADKWRIQADVGFAYSNLAFIMTWTTSDYVDDQGANAKATKELTLWDENCAIGEQSVPDDGSSGFSSGWEDSWVAVGGVCDDPVGPNVGLGFCVNQYTLDIDEENIMSNSLIYNEDTSGNQVTAEIRFCTRFSLHTKGGTPIEVNFLETIVTFNVDLTDGFQIDEISVAPKDRLVRTANQVYQVYAYLCYAPGHVNPMTDPINQGTIVRVCVTPDADAQADGIKMRSVDDFTFVRTGVATQVAIVGPNSEASNGLTSLRCNAGDTTCYFDTLLFAGFYTTPGPVAGSGVASMQFGSSRRLRGEEGRDLQEDDAASAAEFELDFDVNQSDEVFGTSGGSFIGTLVSAVVAMSVAALV